MAEFFRGNCSSGAKPARCALRGLVGGIGSRAAGHAGPAAETAEANEGASACVDARELVLEMDAKALRRVWWRDDSRRRLKSRFLPAETTLKDLVRLAKHCWILERDYL